MERVAVGQRIYSDGAYAEPPCRLDHAAGNFATIGDEYLGEQGRPRNARMILAFTGGCAARPPAIAGRTWSYVTSRSRRLAPRRGCQVASRTRRMASTAQTARGSHPSPPPA